MSIDPRVALERLVSALEEHLASSASRRRDDDPAVEAAYRSVAAAFEDYQEALYDAFGEVTPLEVYDDDDSDDDDDVDDDSDESGYVSELIDAEVEQGPSA
ncbi:hypothetical protein E8P82_04270 [Arthrobacter echini]|uniref:Primosomal protein n=1 Tax=Arthrobacter echini TaxID=1529066 RepID=A0A4S5E6X0_9MICC|nr:hypothetical protein [Arthrobacter echini]THJ67331.1 hypothetical protein E8P82_04270 [Arthrobacter echini]